MSTVSRGIVSRAVTLDAVAALQEVGPVLGIDGDFAFRNFPSGPIVPENYSTSVPVTTISTNKSGATFALSGTDAADFTINTSGEIKFVSPPDHENPADANTDNIYSIVVEATHNGETLTQSLTITVSDEIDIAPSLVAGQSATVVEGSSIGHVVHTVNITNPDNAATTFSISGAGGAFFAIDNSGVITVNAALDFENTPQYQGGPNYGYDSVITLNYELVGGTTGSDAIPLPIFVTNIVDTVPVVTNTPSNITVAEDEETNSQTYPVIVHTPTFTDPDSAITSWSFGAGASTGIGSYFAINSTTGVITQTAPLDFETQTSWNIEFQANFQLDGQSATNTPPQAFVVTVSAVDDESPIFTAPGNIVSIIEDEARSANTPITQIAVTDADSSSALLSIQSVSGGGTAKFALSSPQPSSLGSFLNTTASTFDYENTPTAPWQSDPLVRGYEVVVRATDGNSNFTDYTIQVQITGADDEPEVFPTPSVPFAYIGENASPGALVGSSVSTTRQSGEPSTVNTYELLDASGNDGSAGGRFYLTAINQTTFQLKAAGTGGAYLDYEQATSHLVTVRCTDEGGNVSHQAYTIGVVNVAEVNTATTYTTGYSATSNRDYWFHSGSGQGDYNLDTHIPYTQLFYGATTYYGTGFELQADINENIDSRYHRWHFPNAYQISLKPKYIISSNNNLQGSDYDSNQAQVRIASNGQEASAVNVATTATSGIIFQTPSAITLTGPSDSAVLNQHVRHSYPGGSTSQPSNYFLPENTNTGTEESKFKVTGTNTSPTISLKDVNDIPADGTYTLDLWGFIIDGSAGQFSGTQGLYPSSSIHNAAYMGTGTSDTGLTNTVDTVNNTVIVDQINDEHMALNHALTTGAIQINSAVDSKTATGLTGSPSAPSVVMTGTDPSGQTFTGNEVRPTVSMYAGQTVQLWFTRTVGSYGSTGKVSDLDFKIRQGETLAGNPVVGANYHGSNHRGIRGALITDSRVSYQGNATHNQIYFTPTEPGYYYYASETNNAHWGVIHVRSRSEGLRLPTGYPVAVAHFWQAQSFNSDVTGQGAGSSDYWKPNNIWYIRNHHQHSHNESDAGKISFHPSEADALANTNAANLETETRAGGPSGPYLRIHPAFNTTVTVTYVSPSTNPRISWQKPNVRAILNSSTSVGVSDAGFNTDVFAAAGSSVHNRNYIGAYDTVDVPYDFTGTGTNESNSPQNLYLWVRHRITAFTAQYYNDTAIAWIQILDSTGSNVIHNLRPWPNNISTTNPDNHNFVTVSTTPSTTETAVSTLGSLSSLSAVTTSTNTWRVVSSSGGTTSEHTGVRFGIAPPSGVLPQNNVATGINTPLASMQQVQSSAVTGGTENNYAWFAETSTGSGGSNGSYDHMRSSLLSSVPPTGIIRFAVANATLNGLDPADTLAFAFV